MGCWYREHEEDNGGFEEALRWIWNCGTKYATELTKTIEQNISVVFDLKQWYEVGGKKCSFLSSTHKSQKP